MYDIPEGRDWWTAEPVSDGRTTVKLSGLGDRSCGQMSGDGPEGLWSIGGRPNGVSRGYTFGAGRERTGRLRLG